MIRRFLIVAGILVLVAVLAFPLRQVVYEGVVIPLAYLLWLLGVFYRALPQVVWWAAAAFLVMYWFIKSLIPPIRPLHGKRPAQQPVKGKVEKLAEQIRRTEKGTYNKWVVANRVGKLAFQILRQRDFGKPRSVFEPLDGPDWNAPDDVGGYLQAGLQSSFADFYGKRKLFTRRVKTPLDQDLKGVLDFLESKIDDSIR